jgi:hypothetical protein
MECNQLERLIKEWYLHVKEETMAPARMMQFVDDHVRNCEICQQEPGLHLEIEKIREFVLPESKIPKAVREQNHTPTPEISADHDDDNNHDHDSEEEKPLDEGTIF